MLPCVKLLEYIVENQLDSVYEQTLNLLKLVLSIPVISASTERSTSTLKRIKTYLRNAMKNKRLSQLGTSSIEKELTFMCTKDPTFKERLIDIFANFKTCGTHLQENMNDCVMPTVIRICHHSKNEAITDVPVVLVGNKTDQWGDRMVSLEDGQRRSKEIGCVCFHEISVRESIEQVWAVFRDVCLFWKVHSKFHKLKRSPSDIHITENSQHVVNVNPNVCNGKPTLSSMLARRWTEVEFDEEDENSSGSSKSSFGKNSDHLPPFRSRASTDGHLLSRPRRLRYPPPTPITSTHQSDRRMSISMRGNNNSY